MPRCLPVLYKYTPFVPIVAFYINNFTFSAILDTGCSASVFLLRLARALGLHVNYIKQINLQCANNTVLNIIGYVNFSIKLGHILVANHKFLVSNSTSQACFIGNDIMHRYGVVLDIKGMSFFFRDKPNVVYDCQYEQKTVSFSVQLTHRLLSGHSEEGRIEQFIRSFSMVYRTDGTIGQTDMLKHRIELFENKIFKEKPRFFPPNDAREIERQCKDLLKQGLIRQSTSQYGFNVVLSKKKDGGMRMTINYKKLNSITKPIATPMHNADVIMKSLPTGGYFI